MLEARRRGLRVVAQCGGHGASRLGPLGDALLLRTAGLAGVEIDARAHRARIKAGARWADLADRASFVGLAPAGGFDREASIVGTVLGDGMGWLARRHGLAAASVTAVEYVTADGELERSDELPRDGVITALELKLHPAEDLYAGALFFPFERAAEVLHAWRDWTETAPPEITSVGRLMQFGDGPEVAELVRGRSFAVIEAAFLGTEADGAELIASLRELGPELDTFTIAAPSALGHLHMEPEHPVARLADDGLAGALPGRSDRRPAGRRRPRIGLAARQRRAAPRERRAGDARARLLHARRRAADRHRVGRGDRGAARPRGGRAGALRRVSADVSGRRLPLAGAGPSRSASE